MELAEITNGIVTNIIKLPDGADLADWPGYVLVDDNAEIGGAHDGSTFTKIPKTQAQIDEESDVAVSEQIRSDVRTRLQTAKDNFATLDQVAKDSLLKDLLDDRLG